MATAGNGVLFCGAVASQKHVIVACKPGEIVERRAVLAKPLVQQREIAFLEGLPGRIRGVREVGLPNIANIGPIRGLATCRLEASYHWKNR